MRREHILHGSVSAEKRSLVQKLPSFGPSPIDLPVLCLQVSVNPWLSMERVKGIEPSCAAWKAAVLPLNYTRIRIGIAVLDDLRWWNHTAHAGLVNLMYDRHEHEKNFNRRPVPAVS